MSTPVVTPTPLDAPDTEAYLGDKDRFVFAQLNDDFTSLRSFEDRTRSRLFIWISGILSTFKHTAEATFDDLYDEIEELADDIDVRVDSLISFGQNKKIEAQDEIAALSRQIKRLDDEAERILQLGARASSLQGYVRAARDGTK